MLSVVLNSLFVCLSVSLSLSLFVYFLTTLLILIVLEWIVIKSYEGVGGGNRNKLLNFSGDLDHHFDCPIGNPAVTQQIMNRF